MPPLSYLIDWAWLRFYGPSELGFRIFHSLFVVAGATGLSIFVGAQLDRGDSNSDIFRSVAFI